MAVVDEYFDLVIIGAGPAGLSAGVYAGRALLKTVVLEKGNVGGRAFTTGEIVNYPAIAQTTGPDLIAKMADHARSFGVEIRQQTVKGVDVSGEEKLVFTRKVAYHAKALIIATGTRAHKLGVPGEEEFVGRGVSYCATCDAEFFKDQDVAVIGCGDQAIEESELISKFARSVTIVSRREPGNLRCNARSAARAAEKREDTFRMLQHDRICERGRRGREYHAEGREKRRGARACLPGRVLLHGSRPRNGVPARTGCMRRIRMVARKGRYVVGSQGRFRGWRRAGKVLASGGNGRKRWSRCGDCRRSLYHGEFQEGQARRAPWLGGVELRSFSTRSRF